MKSTSDEKDWEVPPHKGWRKAGYEQGRFDEEMDSKYLNDVTAQFNSKGESDE